MKAQCVYTPCFPLGECISIENTGLFMKRGTGTRVEHQKIL